MRKAAMAQKLGQDVIQASRTKAALVFWIAGLMAFPFYIFAKGSMQMSSFLMLGATVVISLQIKNAKLTLFNKEGTSLMWAMGAFVVYGMMISLFWASWHSDSRIAVPPIYYFFNLIMVFLVLSLYQYYGGDVINITRSTVLASVALQFVLSFFFAQRGYREFLFFKNANQLGYYALVCASILALPYDRGRSMLRDSLYSVGILMCLWLALLSLSKAATISTVIFLMLSGTRNRTQLLIGGLVAVVVLSANISLVEGRIDNLFTRFESLGAEGGDDNLEGRGYDRIWENPEMLIFGAGESGNYRWYDDGRKTEIHSSFGTVLFSYGIPGIVMMGIFIGLIVRSGGMRIVPYMIPEFLFSITHMGLRFVMTWVYFVILFLVTLEWKKERRRAQSAQAAARPLLPA